jgi:hypothetical protein
MRAGARTVQLHEGIERPILGIIALFMPVGLTKRPGLEVSSVLELGVIPDLGSPLIKKEVSRAAARKYQETPWNTNAVSAIVISSCLATRSTPQQVSLERRLAVDACQVI